MPENSVVHTPTSCPLHFPVRISYRLTSTTKHLRDRNRLFETIDDSQIDPTGQGTIEWYYGYITNTLLFLKDFVKCPHNVICSGTRTHTHAHTHAFREHNICNYEPKYKKLHVNPQIVRPSISWGETLTFSKFRYNVLFASTAQSHFGKTVWSHHTQFVIGF